MPNTPQRIALIVVDPQIDFITGTLPVPGAEAAMNGLARHLQETDGRYAVKIVTSDWHPYHHSSFTSAGGPWPRHCVRHAPGSAIWEGLIGPLYETAGEPHLLTKGLDVGSDEYSIFKNAPAAAVIDRLMREHGIDLIELCGLAGDVCVLETLKDGAQRYGGQMFRVLVPFTPSLDGGAALAAAIEALS